MRAWKIDQNGNFVFTNGRMEMVEGDEELLQAVWFALTVNFEEWFINPSFGLDRFEILGGKLDKEHAADLVREAVLKVDRVDTVDDVYIEYKDRSLLISFIFTKVSESEEEETDILEFNRMIGVG